MMQWYTQGGNNTANLKLKIDFTLPKLNSVKIVTWGFHVDDSAKDIYDMILGIDILTSLVLHLKFCEHIIEADNGHLKGSMATMVDLGT